MDKLNSLSYAYHYRNIDSAQANAVRAYKLSDGYSEGRAEACNNQAFVCIVRMQYDEAEKLLDEVLETSDNQVERMVAYVQHMRLCQRRSRNREFHEYRQLADGALSRINEERHQLSARQLRRLHYAESEYAIVNSTYYYYVGLEKKSIEALYAINPNEVQRDTAQLLNWLYNIGAGGIITQGTQQEINQQEFDHLMRCFLIARQGDYPFFAANALEALSEHLMDPDYRRQLLEDNLPAMKFINPEGVDEDMLSGWLAENALNIFEQYGDIYQIAGAYRTLASCFRQIGDYESALYNLEQALSDSLIYQAPDLVASIREQLSVAYAAIDDKPQSDYNRNLYLDLQETTRQDRQLEARASQYEKTAGQLNLMLIAVVIAIILLLFSLWLFNHMNRRKRREDIPDDLFEQKREQLAVQRLRVENGERLSLEQRAKISLVNSITPFIDRIIHEVGEKERRREGVSSEEAMDYIRELTDQINDYNEVLTYWIQLRQGDLSLHIESFPLQSLFDLLGRGRTSFQMKGIDLEVQPTEAVRVKGKPQAADARKGKRNRMKADRQRSGKYGAQRSDKPRQPPPVRQSPDYKSRHQRKQQQIKHFHSLLSHAQRRLKHLLQTRSGQSGRQNQGRRKNKQRHDARGPVPAFSLRIPGLPFQRPEIHQKRREQHIGRCQHGGNDQRGHSQNAQPGTLLVCGHHQVPFAQKPAHRRNACQGSRRKGIGGAHCRHASAEPAKFLNLASFRADQNQPRAPEQQNLHQAVAYKVQKTSFQSIGRHQHCAEQHIRKIGNRGKSQALFQVSLPHGHDGGKQNRETAQAHGNGLRNGTRQERRAEGIMGHADHRERPGIHNGNRVQQCGHRRGGNADRRQPGVHRKDSRLCAESDKGQQENPAKHFLMPGHPGHIQHAARRETRGGVVMAQKQHPDKGHRRAGNGKVHISLSRLPGGPVLVESHQRKRHHRQAFIKGIQREKISREGNRQRHPVGHGVKAEEAFRVSALHIKIGVQHGRRPEQRQQTREDFARAVQPENQRQVVHHRKQHRAVSVSPENLKRGQHRGRGDHRKQKDLLQPA